MNFFAKIWAIISGWFTSMPASTPKADNPAPKQAPTENRINKAAQTPDDYEKSERQKDIEFTAKAIAEHAEHYETHQSDLYADWSRDPDLFIAAAYAVDWTEVVRGYSKKTMHKLTGHGTEFNFKGHDRLRALVTSAIRAEAARRGGDAPDANGMAEDGGQK